MATMCTVSASMSPWLGVKSRSYSGPSAALAYGGVSRRSSLSLSVSNDGPSFFHSSFLSSSSSLDFTSAFSGISLGMGSARSTGMKRGRCFRLVVRSGKAALCLTKRNRSRKSLARTHGFRIRMRTTSGRAIMKRRRAKGRRILCTKTNPNNYRGRRK